MSVTAAKGFVAAGVKAGIRKKGLDLTVLRTTVPAVGTAMFTRNRVQAAPVVVSRAHLEQAEPQAVVINSGVANAATGEQGDLDAIATASEAARLLCLRTEQVLVMSTGVIGVPLPMEKVIGGVHKAVRGALAGRRRGLGRGDHDHRHEAEDLGRLDAAASPSAGWRRAPG